MRKKGGRKREGIFRQSVKEERERKRYNSGRKETEKKREREREET